MQNEAGLQAVQQMTKLSTLVQFIGVDDDNFVIARAKNRPVSENIRRVKITYLL